jgi:deoxyribodipyrimidine photolyase
MCGYLHVQIYGILNTLQQTGSLIHSLSSLQTENNKNYSVFSLWIQKFWSDSNNHNLIQTEIKKRLNLGYIHTQL